MYIKYVHNVLVTTWQQFFSKWVTLQESILQVFSHPDKITLSSVLIKTIYMIPKPDSYIDKLPIPPCG